MTENKLSEKEVFDQTASEEELEQASGGAGYDACRYCYAAPVRHEEPAAPAAPAAPAVETIQPVVASDADLPKNLKLPESSGVKID